MGGLSIWHWLIVLVIVILVFGTKKLSSVGKDLGGAVRGFKEGLKEGAEAPSSTTNAEAAKQVAASKNTIDVEAKEKSGS